MKMILILGFVVSALIHFNAAAVNKNDVTFRLFTRNHPDTYTSITTANLSLIDIDVSLPFKFIIHGYRSSADTKWMLKMKNSYLQKSATNVILVDWQTPASQTYVATAANTKDVGKYLGHLIISLNTEKENPYTNVHLYGHSLGAHISGFAGKHIFKTVGDKIWRITALDAASPLFYLRPSTQRLSVGDATFIDAIHTDNYKFGYPSSIGDVDFFPNGGVCPHSGCSAKRKLNIKDKFSASACCHSMAHVFATEAINSNRFVSTKCNNYKSYMLNLCKNNPTTSMGEYIDTNARGKYYLTTNLQSPYAIG